MSYDAVGVDREHVDAIGGGWPSGIGQPEWAAAPRGERGGTDVKSMVVLVWFLRGD